MTKSAMRACGSMRASYDVVSFGVQRRRWPNHAAGVLHTARDSETPTQKPPSVTGVLAERTGLEPAASGVTGRRYNRLNYRSSAPGSRHLRMRFPEGFRQLREPVGPAADRITNTRLGAVKRENVGGMFSGAHPRRERRAASMATRPARALFTVSSNSLAGSLASTRPAPAWRVSFPSRATQVRIAIARSAFPSKPR